MYSNQTKRDVLVNLIKTLTIALLALGTYGLLYSRFFLNDANLIGGDYSYFMPSMLSGYFWHLENGVFSIPWFTPAFCGGLPFFPNPQSIYYSLPQLLMTWLGPVPAVFITFMVFAGIGLAGCFFLLKTVFRFSAATSFLGGIMFLFNGFYVSRMIMGHVTYHAFMLTPLIALCLLFTCTNKNKTCNKAVGMVFPGLLLSYVIYSGALNLMVPILITIIGVYFLLRLLHQDNPVFWWRFACAGAIALCLSLAKLLPAYFYINTFPRDLYALPGFDGVANATFNVARSLFDSFDYGVAEKLVNLSFPATNLGFDFSIGILPILTLSFYFCLRLAQHISAVGSSVSSMKNGFPVISLVIFLFILFLPVLLNSYYPTWNEFLKQLPYIKNSSLLTRWIAIDILLLIILTCLVFDKFRDSKRFLFGVVFAICALLAEKVYHIDRYKAGLNYDASTIIHTYQQVKESGDVPAIKSIGAFTDTDNRMVMLHGRNDQMTAGISILNCYEPIFGYRLETFPFRTLFPGPVLESKDGYLNVKNPACYIFGYANRCEPGQHFGTEQREQAQAFANYQQYNFSVPASVRVAVIISILSFVFGFIYLAFAAIKIKSS